MTAPIPTRASRACHRLPAVAGALLAFPLFFTRDLQVFRGGLGSHEFSLPLAFAAALVLCGLGFTRVLPALLQPGSLLFIGAMLVMSVVALAVSGGGDVSLLAIYLVPACAGFFLPWAARLRDPAALAAFLRGFARALGVAAVLHLASSIASFGVAGAFAVRGEDSIFGWFSIYQKFIYYATLLAAAYFIALRQERGWLRWVLASVLALDVMLVGAREAVLLLLFYSVFVGVLASRDAFGAIIRIYAYGALAFTGLIVLFMIGQAWFPDAALVQKLAGTLGAREEVGVTAGRFEAMAYVLSYFHIDLPFFFVGSGFTTQVGELGTPHNQYVEWFLRGGMLCVVLNAGLLVLGIAAAANSRFSTLQTVACILFATLLFSNNINTPFRTPYASLFLWALIGSALRLVPPRLRRGTPPEQSEVHR